MPVTLSVEGAMARKMEQPILFTAVDRESGLQANAPSQGDFAAKGHKRKPSLEPRSETNLTTEKTKITKEVRWVHLTKFPILYIFSFVSSVFFVVPSQIFCVTGL